MAEPTPINPVNTASPWEQLQRTIDTGDGSAVEAYLDALPPGETAHTIVRMEEPYQTKLLELLPAEAAADLMEVLSDAHAADLIEDLTTERAAAIVDEMASDEQADLIAELDHEDAEAILDQMTPEEARDVRRLSKYGPDTAGGIMITEYLSYAEHLRTDDVIQDLRRHAERYQDYDVQYAYVVSDDGRFLGTVRLRDLLLTPGSSELTSIMVTDAQSVAVTAHLDELEDFFDRHEYYGAPVVDDRHRLVGVVRRAHVEEALAERSDKAMLRLGGIIAGEELRTMPVGARSVRRLAFLFPNIGLNLLSASVIAIFLPTLEQAVALMIFLPILSDMSGCAGNQAVAVSMRELSLGLVKPYELSNVLFKELGVGLINGLALGLALGLIAWGMRGEPYLGLVVGVAMTLNSIISVCLGGTIPLVFKGLKIDPALASGPVLTTITDMCGFLIALGIATAMLSKLVGT